MRSVKTSFKQGDRFYDRPIVGQIPPKPVAAQVASTFGRKMPVPETVTGYHPREFFRWLKPDKHGKLVPK